MKKQLKKNLIERFSRQIVLKDIGILGQKKILSAKVLVVGTEWAEFRESANKLLQVADNDIFVIDANRHLQDVVVSLGIQYVAVGTPKINEVR